jgi:hypothetical protein
MTASSIAACESAYMRAHEEACDQAGRLLHLVMDQPAPGDDVPITWTSVDAMAELTRRVITLARYVEGRRCD